MPTDINEMQRRGQEIQEGQWKKTPWWKAKEGANQVRLLPPFGDRTTPKIEYKKVFSLGPNNRSIIPRKQFGLSDCPFETYYNELSKRNDEASKKELDSIRIRNRVAFMLIDRSKEAEGPQVWETSLDQLATICALMTNPEWGAIDDPTNGVDLIITYTPQNKTSNGFADYSIQPMRNSTPITANKEQYESWLGKDWFKEFHVGEPSDVDWINGVLTGNEKQSDGDAGTKKEGENLGPQTLPPPPGAATVGTTSYPFAPTDGFYVYLNDKVENMPAQSVYQLFLAGNDVQCCPVDASADGWKLASSLGFKKVEVKTPPAPPAPPGPPAPPAAPAKETAPWMNLPPGEPAKPAIPEVPATGNTVTDDIRSQLVGSR